MKVTGFRVRIMIQKNETVTDRLGNHSSVWTDYFPCWASATDQTGDESEEASQTREEDRMDFTVRYCSKTSAVRSTTHRIIFRDEIYDILAVDHLNFKRRGIKFRCRKVRR